MRIVAAAAIPVRVPRRNPARSAFGLRTETYAGLIRLETDSGLVGWGEIALVWEPYGSGLCGFAEQTLLPAVMGEDPRELGALRRRLDSLAPDRGHLPAIAGVEMALLDLLAQHISAPVYQLLGTVRRDEIPLSASIHQGDAETTAGYARDIEAQGFRTLKVKLGNRPWAEDLACLRAVRASVAAETVVRIDLNQSWLDLDTALAALPDLEELSLEVLEQPFPATEHALMHELRRHTSLPIAADDALWGVEDAEALLAADAMDIANVYVCEAGGVLNARDIVLRMHEAGLTYWLGSMPELGVGTLATIHLAAVLPDTPHASDACGSWYHAADILAELLDFSGGVARVPNTPGWGVAINEAAVDEYRIPAGSH